MPGIWPLISASTLPVHAGPPARRLALTVLLVQRFQLGTSESGRPGNPCRLPQAQLIGMTGSSAANCCVWNLTGGVSFCRRPGVGD